MASRGFLIRFIDIGLIVLFGFLMISDIDALSRVDLAGAATESEPLEAPPEEEENRIFIVVEIDDAGRFVVYEPEGPGAGEATVADSPDALAVALSARRAIHEASGAETIVLIEPSPASLVQRTVDVMDVCDRIGLPKSLRMDIEITAAGSGEEGA